MYTDNSLHYQRNINYRPNNKYYHLVFLKSLNFNIHLSIILYSIVNEETFLSTFL